VGEVGGVVGVVGVVGGVVRVVGVVGVVPVPGAGAGAGGAFLTCFIACPRLMLFSTIAVFSAANGTFSLRDAFNAAMNCPWLRKPALACSSVIPCGNIAVTRAFCWGLRAIFVEIAFGSGAGAGVVGGVVGVLPSVPVPGAGSVPGVGVDPPVVGVVVGDVVEADATAGADFFADVIRDPLPDFGLSDPLCDPLIFPDFGLADAFGGPLTFLVAGAFEPPFATCTFAFGPLLPSAAAGTTIVAVTSETATKNGNG
jgi:hypothetical protein